MKRLIDPPHWSKFTAQDPATGLQLRGVADEILELESGGLVILDYKTAKVTEKQDELLPMYEVQLNSYAFIAEKTGMGKVVALGLQYMDPQVTPEYSKLPENRTAEGFRMTFRAVVRPIQLDQALVSRLLRKAHDVLSQEQPPPGAEGCKDCLAVDNLLKATSGRLSEMVKPERKKKVRDTGNGSKEKTSETGGLTL